MRDFDLEAFITRKRKGFVETEKLLDRYGELDEWMLREQATPLVASGVLAPTNKAKIVLQGNPPLYTKYRIRIADVEPYDASGLHPRIAESSWVKNNPEMAREQDALLRGLSDALCGRLSVSGLDHREAGYVLALDEHVFDDKSDGLKVLNGLSVTFQELGVHEATFPPTMETYPDGDGTIIVSENVGPYNRLRRVARDPENARDSFGFVPSAVVLGNGNAASRPGFIPDVLEQVRCGKGASILYWGDVDRAGVAILAAVIRSSTVACAPWTATYHAVLQRARKRAPRVSGDRRETRVDDDVLTNALDKEDAILARRLLERNSLLPQEALPPAAYQDGSLSWR